MEEIIKLREKIEEIALRYVIIQERSVIEKTMEILPQVQEFVVWFLGGNQFGIAEEEYQMLSENLLTILNDVSRALEQKDKVLLFDSLYFGIYEYLKMFTVEETEVDSE